MIQLGSKNSLLEKKKSFIGLAIGLLESCVRRYNSVSSQAWCKCPSFFVNVRYETLIHTNLSQCPPFFNHPRTQSYKINLVLKGQNQFLIGNLISYLLFYFFLHKIKLVLKSLWYYDSVIQIIRIPQLSTSSNLNKYTQFFCIKSTSILGNGTGFPLLIRP